MSHDTSSIDLLKLRDARKLVLSRDPYCIYIVYIWGNREKMLQFFYFGSFLYAQFYDKHEIFSVQQISFNMYILTTDGFCFVCLC